LQIAETKTVRKKFDFEICSRDRIFELFFPSYVIDELPVSPLQAGFGGAKHFSSKI